MSDNPCHHRCDFTDGADPNEELDCCTPLPVRRECGAPVLPVPECDEQDPIITYDPETEEYTALTILYDSLCSPILDSTNDPILTLIG